MNIFLVRHGKYNPSHIDRSEGLSEEGRRDILLLHDYFNKEKISFDDSFCSPKTRAVQTAEILCQNSKKTNDLSPSSSAKKAYDIIPKEGNILVVTHLPILEDLSEMLGERVSFEMGTLAQFTEEGLKRVIHFK